MHTKACTFHIKLLAQQSKTCVGIWGIAQLHYPWLEPNVGPHILHPPPYGMLLPVTTLQDLLITPGQSLADVTARDAAQVSQLNIAASAARVDAVAAITGQLPGSTLVSKRSVGPPQGVAASGAGEIEATEDDHPQATNPAGDCAAGLLSRGHQGMLHRIWARYRQPGAG